MMRSFVCFNLFFRKYQNIQVLKNLCKFLHTDKAIHQLVKDPATQSCGLDNLKNMFEIRDIDARSILKKHPEFNHLPFETLACSLTYLTDYGVPVDRILQHPWLLLIPSNLLEKRLKMAMSILPVNEVPVAIPFLAFPIRKLMEIGVLWKSEASRERVLLLGKFNSRLNYLAYSLKCSEMEVADCMVKVKSLSTIRFRKIHDVLNTLIDGGMHPQYIKEDPWIFIHNLELMRERLHDANSRCLPMDFIKPWILRCSLSKYESYIQRTLNEQKIKAKEEKVEIFLERKLNWETSRTKEILNKVPALRKYKASKLERMISFLLEKGFTSNDIATTPRVLCHSVATVAQKLSELSELSHGKGYSLQSLSILCQNSKSYMRYTNSLNSSKTSPAAKS